jgi:hypothetical protein
MRTSVFLAAVASFGASLVAGVSSPTIGSPTLYQCTAAAFVVRPSPLLLFFRSGLTLTLLAAVHLLHCAPSGRLSRRSQRLEELILYFSE